MVAVVYLLALLALDLRFRLGVWGLALALAGFVAILAWQDVAPRLGKRVRRGLRSTRTLAQTEQLVEEGKLLVRRRDSQGRASPAARDALGRITARLDEIARIIRQDPNKHAFAEWFLGSYASPIHDLIRHFVTLAAREVASARSAIERTELELPRIERQLDELFEAIHRGDISALKSINEMLE